MRYAFSEHLNLELELALTRAQAYPFLTRGSGHHMGIVKAPAGDYPRRGPEHDAVMALRHRITTDLRQANMFTLPAFDACRSDVDAFSQRSFSTGSGTGLDLWAEYGEEDIFVLRAEGPETLRLVAGHTWFPSRGNPMERVGQDLFELHDPVPEMGKLPKMIHAFFRRLAVGEAFFRVNWTLTDDPDWYQPKTITRIQDSLAAGVPVLDAIFYRTEKQHIIRLSEECWVFLVNVRQVPVSQFAGESDLIEGLYEAVLGWSNPMKQYKSWARYGRLLLEARDGE